MSELLCRRNTILEALTAGRRDFHRLLLAEDATAASTNAVRAAARQRGVREETISAEKLAQLAHGEKHQGALLAVGDYPYVELTEILDSVPTGALPLLLILDLVQSPGNIGRVLRSAEAFGVHGVVLPERRAGGVTPAVADASMGASEHMRIAQVTNVVQAMEQMRARDIWLAGLDMSADAQPLGKMDLNRALAVVIGNEGSGLRRLVRERCDFLVRIPMHGRVASLNAAIAGSLALFAAVQARQPR